MKKYVILFTSILLLSSCASYFLTGNRWSDRTVHKNFETKSQKVTIETFIDKYSPSKKWFYGTIKICNKTTDTLKFNFNQTLIADSLPLLADYNLLPVSWACDAFDIKPKECKTWEVAWRIKKAVVNFDKIYVKADTQIFVSTCRH